MPNDNNNNLPTTLISSLLAKKLSGNITNDQMHTLTNDFDKSINWKLLYKTLESSVEEFILLNNGNPTVDGFRDNTLNNLSEVVQLLIGNTPKHND